MRNSVAQTAQFFIVLATERGVIIIVQIKLSDLLYQLYQICFCMKRSNFTSQSDAVAAIEKEFDYRDEHWDFIQYHVRLFCLQCEFYVNVFFPHFFFSIN